MVTVPRAVPMLLLGQVTAARPCPLLPGVQLPVVTQHCVPSSHPCSPPSRGTVPPHPPPPTLALLTPTLCVTSQTGASVPQFPPAAWPRDCSLMPNP